MRLCLLSLLLMFFSCIEKIFVKMIFGNLLSVVVFFPLSRKIKLMAMVYLISKFTVLLVVLLMPIIVFLIDMEQILPLLLSLPFAIIFFFLVCRVLWFLGNWFKK